MNIKKQSLLFIAVLFCTASLAQLRVKPNGQVGIGTLNPNYALEVVGNGILVKGQASPPSAPFIRGGTTYTIIPDYTWAGDMMTGIAHPNFGRVRFISAGWELGGWNLVNSTYLFDVSGCAASWLWATNSDERFKKNIKALGTSMEMIMRLKPCTYELKVEEFKKYNPPAGIHYGFIAQELQKVVPEIVKENNDGYLTVDYSGLIPILVKGLKEQQEEIDQLKAILKRIEK
jgi:hypothetical protein